jgi:hypothetical protein
VRADVARPATAPRVSLREDGALLLALLLLGLVLVAPGAIPSPRLRALAALFGFFYSVGELARRALFPRFRLDPLRRALVSLSIGNAALCLLVGTAWLWGNRLSAAGRAFPLLVIALLVIAWWRRAEAPDGPPPAPFPTRSALLLVLLAVPLLWFSDPLLSVDDSLDHVGSLRKRIEQDAVFPRSTFYAASNENGPDARKGLLHGVLALVASTTRTPVLGLWDALPFAASLWVLLAALAMGRTLFGGGFRPLAAALLFAMTWEGSFGGEGLTRLSHPSRMVLAPYWTIWALLLDTGRPAPLGLLALLGFGIAAVHAGTPVLLGLALAFLLIFILVLGRDEARRSLGALARGGAFVLLGSAPYLALRVSVSTPLVDTIHTEPQGLLFWTRSLFTVNPLWTLQSWGLLGLLAVPIVLLFLGRARREVAFAFLASGALGAIGVLANPLATPPLHRALGYLVVRLAWFAPQAFVLAHGVAEAGEGLRRFPRVRPLPAIAALALLLVLGAQLAATARALPRWSAPDASSMGFRGQVEDFAAVDRAIGPPAVVLADPATGYAVPALTRHWTVCAMAQHTPPNDPDARDRLRDTRRVLSPYVNAADAVALLRRYGAEWILLCDAPAARLSRYEFHPGPGTFAAAVAKLDARSDLFSPVLSRGSLRLYRLTEAALAGPLPAEGPASRPLPVAAARPEPVAEWEEGAFLLHEGAVLSDSVGKGGRLAIASVWERRRDLPDANRYVIVRLARRDTATPLDATPFARIARRAEDALSRQRTRARLGFAPGDGFLPPDDWPIGVPLRDVTEVAIPADLAPGEYDVTIRVVEEAFYPNLRPADFFSLVGSYDGASIGTVRVTSDNEEIETS